MTDERSRDHDANSRAYWERVASDPGKHGHDEGGSHIMMSAHALVDPEYWAVVLKDPAKFEYDAEQAEKLAAFFCRPHSGGVAVVRDDAHGAYRLKDAHVIAYWAHFRALLDGIDECPSYPIHLPNRLVHDHSQSLRFVLTRHPSAQEMGIGTFDPIAKGRR